MEVLPQPLQFLSILSPAAEVSAEVPPCPSLDANTFHTYGLGAIIARKDDKTAGIAENV